jgi:hypothetical protein
MSKSEEFIGDKFRGENYENNKLLGTESLVTVDLFRRANQTFFLRVSLRSINKPSVISRHEIDIDRYPDQAACLNVVAAAGGALAEHQYEMYGDTHEPSECAKAAHEAAKEIFEGR